MNELVTQNEKMMTTKELAEVLGVSNETVRTTARKLIDPSKSIWKVINGGKSQVFTEEQATAIKLELQNHSKVNFNTPTTSIERALFIQKAMQMQNDIINELQSKVTELTPKAEFYDAVTGSKDCIEMKEVAKILNIKDMGRNKLFEILRNKKILDRNNQPYQKYVDAGLFRIVESKYSVNGDVRINLKTVVFQKGIDFIKKILFEDVGTKMSVDCHKLVHKIEGK